MKIQHLIAIFIILVLFASCTPDENVIDTTKDSWKLFVAKDNPPVISLLSMPDGAVLKANLFFEANNEDLPGPVTKIVERFDSVTADLFLFIPSKNKVEVVDKFTFKRKATLDFSAQGLSPVSMAIANFSDGYIIHNNDSVVSLIDLTVLKFVRNIKVGKSTTSIACSGINLYVANQLSHTVSLIYTNQDDKVHTSISVSPGPSFIDFNTKGTEALVVSLGTGKGSIPGDKSPAVASFIDAANNNVISTKAIEGSGVAANDVTPLGLAVTENGWAFIPTDKGLFRLDVKKRNIIKLLSKEHYASVMYNYKRKEIIYIKNTGGNYNLSTADNSTGVILKTVSLPATLTAFYPY